MNHKDCAKMIYEVNAPDYESLSVIQTAKRLYKSSSKTIDDAKNIELTRKFAEVKRVSPYCLYLTSLLRGIINSKIKVQFVH
jgi:hypothetical protein